jgi:hypothetical protein
MTTISHYQLLHWAHQIAQDATQSAVDSAQSIGRPWTEREAELYRAGALSGAQSMISTLKLQSVIAADYK